MNGKSACALRALCLATGLTAMSAGQRGAWGADAPPASPPATPPAAGPAQAAPAPPDEPLPEARSVDDYEPWYLGFHLVVGVWAPRGAERFGAPEGEEFGSAPGLRTGIDLDIGRYLQASLSAGVTIGCADADAYAEGFTLAYDIDSSGPAACRRVLGHARAFPFALGFLRPFAGIALGYADVELKATGSAERCSDGGIFGGGGCSLTEVSLVSVRYQGVATALSAGLRYDFPLQGGARKKKHPAGVLVPLYVEAGYAKNFWFDADVSVNTRDAATPEDAIDVESTRLDLDPSDLDLDHLFFTAGFGVLW